MRPNLRPVARKPAGHRNARRQLAGEPSHQLAAVDLQAVGYDQHVRQPHRVEAVCQPAAGVEAVSGSAELDLRRRQVRVVEPRRRHHHRIVEHARPADFAGGRAAQHISARICPRPEIPGPSRVMLPWHQRPERAGPFPPVFPGSHLTSRSAASMRTARLPFDLRTKK